MPEYVVIAEADGQKRTCFLRAENDVAADFASMDWVRTLPRANWEYVTARVLSYGYANRTNPEG